MTTYVGISTDPVSQLPETKENLVPTALRYVNSFYDQVNSQPVFNQTVATIAFNLRASVTTFSWVGNLFSLIYQHPDAQRAFKAIYGNNWPLNLAAAFVNELLIIVNNALLSPNPNYLFNNNYSYVYGHENLTFGAYQWAQSIAVGTSVYTANYIHQPLTVTYALGTTITYQNLVTLANTAFPGISSLLVASTALKLPDNSIRTFSLIKKYFPDFDWGPRTITQLENWDTKIGNVVYAPNSDTVVQFLNTGLVDDLTDLAVCSIYGPIPTIAGVFGGMPLYQSAIVYNATIMLPQVVKYYTGISGANIVGMSFNKVGVFTRTDAGYKGPSLGRYISSNPDSTSSRQPRGRV